MAVHPRGRGGAALAQPTVAPMDVTMTERAAAPATIAARWTSWITHKAVWLVAVAAFAIEMAVSGRYGYDRDELYFLIAGQHLAFGYVDQPPITPLLARADSILTGRDRVDRGPRAAAPRLRARPAGDGVPQRPGRQRRGGRRGDLRRDRTARPLGASVARVPPVRMRPPSPGTGSRRSTGRQRQGLPRP
jgi:hypothetical protein